VNDDGILADIDAAIAHLRGGFVDRDIGIVGFCFGGRVAFLTAAPVVGPRSPSTAVAS
jgi:dienelactone hydrolase